VQALASTVEWTSATVLTGADRVELLTELARGHLGVGSHDMADRLLQDAVGAARQVAQPEARARALTVVAANLTEGGPAPRAANLLGEALASAHWEISLPVIARLDPSAVLQAAAGFWPEPVTPQ
jgi:hypothetical protein